MARTRRTGSFPLISAIVICHNERHAIRKVLAHLASQEPSRDGHEVIIACNKSTDGTEEVIADAPVAKLLLSKNYHTGALHNAAAQIAQGDILFFIDGHMLLDRDALRRIEAALSDPAVAGVCGYYTAPEGSTPVLEAIRDLRYHAKGRKALYTTPQLITLEHFFTVTGGIFAIRRNVFEAIGGYDISFQRDACEDIFVAVKAVNAGYCLSYDPGLRARHYHHHSSVRSFLIRGAIWEPRGLARLMQRAVDADLHLPFDNYVIQLPVSTTGVLLYLLIRTLLRKPSPDWLIIAAITLQVVEVLPFATVCPGRFPRKVRALAACYWIYVNVFRLLYGIAAFVYRFAPMCAEITVVGSVYEMRDVSPTIFQSTMCVRYPQSRAYRFWIGLARVCTGMVWDGLRHFPRHVHELLAALTLARRESL